MLTANEILGAAGKVARRKPAPDRNRHQLDRLDAYFKAGGSLTVTEAISAIGCYALSQRVGQLRREQHKPVEWSWELTPGGARVKRYRYAAHAVELPAGQLPGQLPLSFG
jgi:hypothetical protein